jgi:glycerophosphoryl diester phosphodiesterase
MKLLVGPGQLPFISAHRGFSTVAPENTMAALEAAWKTGATAIEIDVWLSSDGELLLMHDRDIKHTTDGRGPVSELSCSASMPEAGSASVSPASASPALRGC